MLNIEGLHISELKWFYILQHSKKYKGKVQK